MSTDDVDKATLSYTMEEFDNCMATLEDIHAEYELECEDMDDVIEEVADYRNNVKQV